MSPDGRAVSPQSIAFIDDNCEACWQLAHCIIGDCESANNSEVVVNGKLLAVVVVRIALEGIAPLLD